jgi:hypothetical protein
VLEGAGLTVAWLSYWNTILFPVAVAARLAKRFGNADSRSDIRDVAPWLNQSLTAVRACEARTLQVTQLPWGVSLIGIASRA